MRKSGATWDAPSVLTETVKETALPETGRLAGTVHVAPYGAPEQVNDNVPLKPEPGVARRLNCAVCPAVTVVVDDPPADTAMVAAGFAIPFRVMDCGEFAALSVMVSVVVRTPAACGVKTTEIVQAALAGIEPLQVSAEMLKSGALNPLRTALRT